MALTSIADQKTPGRPIEITFAAETGLPSPNQEVILVGHKDASSGSVAPYDITTINNIGSLQDAIEEAEGKFGPGSPAVAMVTAAASALAGLSSVPVVKVIPLASGDTSFGPSDEALDTLRRNKAEFVVSPYDAQTDTANRTKLRDICLEMSGAQRVDNNQFGTVGVAANYSEADPSLLDEPDSQFLALMYKRDSAPVRTVGELASACAARIAAGAVPFNPLDDVVVRGEPAPTVQADFLTVGAGLESETVLGKGWTPLRVFPNGDVAFVRTITSRLSPDGSGSPLVTAYYDVQDFQVLYFWRKTLFTRFSQPDLKQAKASSGTATLILGEIIRLARTFEDQNMFQAVDQLAKQFRVERSLTDRHRFDVKTPVNVIPGLHVIATNIEATTEFDILSL